MKPMQEGRIGGTTPQIDAGNVKEDREERRVAAERIDDEDDQRAGEEFDLRGRKKRRPQLAIKATSGSAPR